MPRILISLLIAASAVIAACANEPPHHTSSSFGSANVMGGMSPGTGLHSVSGAAGFHSPNPSFRAGGIDLLPDNATQNPDGTITYNGGLYRRK